MQGSVRQAFSLPSRIGRPTPSAPFVAAVFLVLNAEIFQDVGVRRQQVRHLNRERTGTIQTPGLMVILLELDNAHRQICTDGRTLPRDPQPSWLGYPVVKWEGDTMAVDTVRFNDKAWLEAIGHPRSEAMHLTERTDAISLAPPPIPSPAAE